MSADEIAWARLKTWSEAQRVCQYGLDGLTFASDVSEAERKGMRQGIEACIAMIHAASRHDPKAQPSLTSTPNPQARDADVERVATILERACDAYTSTMCNWTTTGSTLTERRFSEGERDETAEERLYEALASLQFGDIQTLLAALRPAPDTALRDQVVDALVEEGRAKHRVLNDEQQAAADDEARAFYRKVIDRYRTALAAPSGGEVEG